MIPLNKKLYFTFWPFLFFCLYTFAQEKHPYFRLDKGITQKDYQPGVMLVRLKPQYRDAFQGTSAREKTVSWLRQQLGIRQVRPVAPQAMLQQAIQRRQKPPSVDLSTMYVLNFNAQQSIEEAINAMYASGLVIYAEPSYVRKAHLTPNDPLQSSQNYLNIIEALDAWDITQGSEDVVIGIVDSGIDTDHEDLADKKAINEDEIPDNGVDDDDDGFVDNVWGWDFIGNDINDIQEDNDPDEGSEDNDSHGTYVAGCTVAETNNNTGIAGVGYNTKFLVTKHSYPGDTANSIYAGYLGISYMANQGVDIINLSFGGPGRNQFVQDLIDYAVVDQGCLVVASAGNDGSSTENYPAAYNHVLSVTATRQDDVKASFSNTALSVDISAPGTGILTTAADNRYATVQGTSFSAPLVSGAAALLKAAFPEMTGMQIGEILRVTADESIYEKPDNPQNRLGKGRLNIVRALTEQYPSIRIQESNLQNTQGRVPQEGDTVLITGAFVNYLWPSSSALTVTLSTDNAYVEILEEQVPLGVIAMNDTVRNEQTPFRMVISQDTPENTRIDLLVTYNDGVYQDYEYLSILVNPSYLNVEENQVSTTVSNNGRIGYQDNTLETRDEGLGFIFEDANLLFEMGLMLGTSAEQLSNAVRSGTDENPDNDFQPLGTLRTVQPGEYAYSEVVGRFNDEQAGVDKSNVTVNFRTLVWVEEPDDHYIMIRYAIRNDGEDSLLNFHTGLYADWDIGEGDRADWDETYRLGYVYSAQEEGRLFAGIQELSGKPNYFAIDNDQEIQSSPWGVYDGFTDEEKFESMSSEVGRKQAGFSTAGGTDVSHTVGSGPYSIAPGDSIQVVFALHGALSLSELQASAQAAIDQYESILQISPPEASDVRVCYGDTATLKASGAGSFRWYDSKTGGNLLDTGAVYTTGPVTEATSFFVATVVNNEESVRIEVKVDLALNAALIFDGSARLCSGDSVVLSVAEADAYQWSTGDTTQSVVVQEAGAYFVQVFNDSLGCTATSDTLLIEMFPAPAADFQFEMTGTALDTSEVVQFTDQSTGEVVSWFWEFGDGDTSTMQNPEHRYEATGEYTVSLEVTSAGGCADSSIQTIDVVTDVDDPVVQKEYYLFPNPASTKATLPLEEPVSGTFRISLWNTEGKQIRTIPDTAVSSQSITLDLQGLVPGTYVVQLWQAEKVSYYRLVISP